MAKIDLTPELIKETLTYDPATGIFTWVVGGHSRSIGKAAGSLHPDGYIYIRAKGGRYKAHRLAWLLMHGEWPIHEIDHINGVKNDNRFSNHRDVPKRVNMQNQRKAKADNKSSGLLGVRRSSHTPGKWLAEIRIEGRRKHIGVFSNPNDAHEAYIAEKRKLHLGCVI